jgi:glucose/arabinose dehydrogenase
MGNVDDDATAAQLRKFPTASSADARGSVAHWSSGILWASGMRNEVGIRFDNSNPRRLWGVENGVDYARRDDLGDVHNDNPGEEVNLFDRPGGASFGSILSLYIYMEFLFAGRSINNHALQNICDYSKLVI